MIEIKAPERDKLVACPISADPCPAKITIVDLYTPSEGAVALMSQLPPDTFHSFNNGLKMSRKLNNVNEQALIAGCAGIDEEGQCTRPEA